MTQFLCVRPRSAVTAVPWFRSSSSTQPSWPAMHAARRRAVAAAVPGVGTRAPLCRLRQTARLPAP